MKKGVFFWGGGGVYYGLIKQTQIIDWYSKVAATEHNKTKARHLSLAFN